MLYADRKQAIGFKLDRIALAIERVHHDSLGSGHALEESGHRQAALICLLFATAGQNARVDQAKRLVSALRDIDDDGALIDIDLGRGEADTGGRVHGFE